MGLAIPVKVLQKQLTGLKLIHIAAITRNAYANQNLKLTTVAEMNVTMTKHLFGQKQTMVNRKCSTLHLIVNLIFNNITPTCIHNYKKLSSVFLLRIDRDCPETWMDDWLPSSDYCYYIEHEEKTFKDHREGAVFEGRNGYLLVIPDESHQNFFSKLLKDLLKDTKSSNKNIFIGLKANFEYVSSTFPFNKGMFKFLMCRKLSIINLKLPISLFKYHKSVFKR